MTQHLHINQAMSDAASSVNQVNGKATTHVIGGTLLGLTWRASLRGWMACLLRSSVPSWDSMNVSSHLFTNLFHNDFEGENETAKHTNGIKLVNSILIERPLEEVFEYCFDLENELKWNPEGLLSLEALTPRPIDVGTKYLALWKGSPPMTCEYTWINRPVDWEVYASGKGMDVDVRGQVAQQGSGTLLTVTMTLSPRGLMRLLAPILKRSFQRGEVKNLASVKAHMEGIEAGDRSPVDS